MAIDKRPIKISVPGAIRPIKFVLPSLNGLKEWQDAGDVEAPYDGDYVDENENPYTATTTIANVTTTNRVTNSVLVYHESLPFPPGTVLQMDLVAASNATVDAEGTLTANYTTVNNEQLKVSGTVQTEDALASGR